MVAMPGVEHAISEFERVIGWSRQHHSRLGYFAAMYLGVTKAMVAPIRASSLEGRPPAGAIVFDDPDRLDRFVRIFADRYFDAFDNRADLDPSHPWAVHFAHCEGGRSTILQILMSGANAHMNLDLSLASLAVADANLDGLRDDFMRINLVLESQIEQSQDRVLKLSPTMRLANRWPKVSARVVGFTIGTARDFAWKNARQIHERKDGLDGPSIDTEQELALLVGEHGHRIVRPPWPIHLPLAYGAAPFEESDVDKVLDQLVDAQPVIDADRMRQAGRSTRS